MKYDLIWIRSYYDSMRVDKYVYLRLIVRRRTLTESVTEIIGTFDKTWCCAKESIVVCGGRVLKNITVCAKYHNTCVKGSSIHESYPFS